MLALTTGTTKGVIILAVYLIYMQIENRVIQPVIVSKAVDIPPFVAMVAVLVGGAAAGVIGAVLVTPLVGVAKSLLNREASAPKALVAPEQHGAGDGARSEPLADVVERGVEGRAAEPIEGQFELDRGVVVEVAHRHADQREPLMLDHRGGRRQQRARGREDRVRVRGRLIQRVGPCRPREVVEPEPEHDRAPDPAGRSHPARHTVDEADQRGVDGVGRFR